MTAGPSMVVTFDCDPRAAEYAPPAVAGRTDRLSLAWWASTSDDASPVFAPVGCGDVRTLVAIWPTDSFGLVEGWRLEEVAVKWWTVPGVWFDQLRARHRHWHLGRHDVLISGQEVTPCRDSLWRRAIASGHPSATAIANSVAAHIG